MGLLETLDFHDRSKGEDEGNQFEYQLYSWGKIFPQLSHYADIEDAVHHGHLEARYILDKFPFILFISKDSMPQKLCLTFRPAYETRGNISGTFSDETAKEFAAFLSLVSRRRVFVDKQTRYDNIPIEEDVDLYIQSHSQEPQWSKLIKRDEIYQLLNNLQKMDRGIARAFILAMRLYHSAIDIMYVEPEFSYLLLVTCLESISSGVYATFRPENGEGYLNSRFPGWKIFYVDETPEAKECVMEMLLKAEHFDIQKLKKFVRDYLPDKYWNEDYDDAKPRYFQEIYNFNGLKIQPSDRKIQEWEKIQEKDLEKKLRNIYDARSDLIHRGLRLPPSIVSGHFTEIPIKAFDDLLSGSFKVPPLLTFERLVSYSMVEFLRKYQSS